MTVPSKMGLITVITASIESESRSRWTQKTIGETFAEELLGKPETSRQTFYLWKKKYAGFGLSELHELRELLQLGELDASWRSGHQFDSESICAKRKDQN
jgi:hypothetical protein